MIRFLVAMLLCLPLRPSLATAATATVRALLLPTARYHWIVRFRVGLILVRSQFNGLSCAGQLGLGRLGTGTARGPAAGAGKFIVVVIVAATVEVSLLFLLIG